MPSFLPRRGAFTTTWVNNRSYPGSKKNVQNPFLKHRFLVYRWCTQCPQAFPYNTIWPLKNKIYGTEEKGVKREVLLLKFSVCVHFYHFVYMYVLTTTVLSRLSTLKDLKNVTWHLLDPSAVCLLDKRAIGFTYRTSIIWWVLIMWSSSLK